MAVEFYEENDFRHRMAQSGERLGWVSKLVIKLGLAKDAKGAQTVLIVVLILVLLATAYTLWG